MDYFLAETNAPGLVRLANMASLGQNIVDTYDEFEPSEKWCENAMLARHSTLDWASVVFLDMVRTDVCSQIVRHTTHYPRFSVQSWRPDWVGKPRPRSPEEKRLLAQKWNPRALQDMAQERLCYKAMRETQEYIAFEMREALVSSNDPFVQAIGISMVPACVYRYGCNQPKSRSCGFFKVFRAEEGEYKESMWERYLVYNCIVSGLKMEKITRQAGEIPASIQ